MQPRSPRRTKRRLVAHALVPFALGLACNPVLEDQIAALGPEATDVSTGPLHRPGQPCTLCHDGAVGDPPAFSAAGTVYENASSTSPLANATVTFTGADGETHPTTTNAVGNFYVTPAEFVPKYPMRVSVTSNGTTVTMQSHVGWASSCATCHADPAGPTSPGHVYFVVPNGKTP